MKIGLSLIILSILFSCRISVPAQSLERIVHVIALRFEETMIFREDLIMYDGVVYSFSSVNLVDVCNMDEVFKYNKLDFFFIEKT